MIASRSSEGGGFPGLAVACLFCVLFWFGVAMLIASRPWEGGGSLGPQAMSVAPDIGVDLGDSNAVAEPAPDSDDDRVADSGPRVASAQVAGSGGAYFPGGFAQGPASTDEPEAGQDTTVSPGVAVARQAPRHRPPPAHAPKPAVPVVAAKPPPSAGATPPGATGPTLSPPPATPAGPQLVANFENGLTGWSTSVLGDSIPRVVTGAVRDGSKSAVIRLVRDQSRSQLALGGDGGYDGAIQIRDGEEFAFAFSFYIERMAYGAPGADNLLMQLRSDGSESHIFGLQLWDYAVEGGGRGLWSSGEAVSGDRFLDTVAEKEWHDVIIHFKASNQGAGYYEVYLDGQLVDARNEVSLIAPGSDFAQIEAGLFREADVVRGTSEIRIDAAKLGQTLESVLP